MSYKVLSLYAYFLLPPLVLSGVIWVYGNNEATAEVLVPELPQSTEQVATVARTHPFLSDYQTHPNAILIDIRTSEEYSSGHIPEAINIDYYDALFTKHVREAVGDKAVFIYCRSGNRTSDAAKRLRSQGLTVYELPGGILSYRGELATD